MKDMVLETIRNYHANPEQTAAEESWDYVQFQVRETPPRSRLDVYPSLYLWDTDVAPPPAWR